MRHRNKKPVLDRKKAPRAALLRNLATSLVLYERLRTTKAKAKAVAPVVEKAITVAKHGDLTARRRLLAVLYDKKAVAKIMEVIAPRFEKRSSGYTRITQLERRQGDGAQMAIVEILEN